MRGAGFDGLPEARVIHHAVAVAGRAAFVEEQTGDVLAVAVYQFGVEIVGEIVPFLIVEPVPVRIRVRGGGGQEQAGNHEC